MESRGLKLAWSLARGKGGTGKDWAREISEGDSELSEREILSEKGRLVGWGVGEEVERKEKENKTLVEIGFFFFLRHPI